MERKHFVIRNGQDLDAIEEVPLRERVPDSSTLDLLRQGAEIAPDRTAIYALESGELNETTREVSFFRAH